VRGHIKNIYELYDLPVNDIFEMIDGLFSGDLSVIKNPVEKMDGQNLTFTVIDGNLRFFFKGTTLTSIKSGGLDAAGIREKYASDEKASVRQAYLDAYESLKHLARSHSNFFRNGHVVIEAALIDPRNINTIPYKNPGIYFIQAWDLDSDIKVDSPVYRVLLREAIRSNTKVPVFAPHKINFKNPNVSFEDVIDIVDDIGTLLTDHNLNDDSTIGDLVVSMVESHIVKYTFIPAKIRKDASRRLVMKRGPIAGSFKKHGMGDSWDLFKKLERQARLIVAEARIPLDNIIQKIGAITFRAVDFQLNAGDPSEIRKGIRIIKSGFADSRLIGTPEQINEIRILLKCIKENEALIEKSTEGFVFEWKGHETKLVGMFTPVNRLNALFTYGDKPVTFSKRSYRTNIYNDWENWYGW
jgi:hypothetical protein